MPKPAARAPSLQALRGEETLVLVKPDQTLLQIAFEHRLGFEAVARLNPGLDPWIPSAGSVVHLPTRLILPDIAHEGLVINLPEMRLYDFTVDPPEIFAVAVGDVTDPSPVGEYRVGDKRIDPAWHVPASIRLEKPELPAVVPPGPDNPLGSRWMTIGTTSYGIHGTNVRWSIGREATHGCIRLYEDEMQRLYERIKPGTRLRLIYHPYKWGIERGRVYVEVHPDLYGRQPDRLADALALPRSLGLLDRVDVRRVWDAVDAASGLPVDVGRVDGSLADATCAPTS